MVGRRWISGLRVGSGCDMYAIGVQWPHGAPGIETLGASSNIEGYHQQAWPKLSTRSSASRWKIIIKIIIITIDSIVGYSLENTDGVATIKGLYGAVD